MAFQAKHSSSPLALARRMCKIRRIMKISFFPKALAIAALLILAPQKSGAQTTAELIAKGDAADRSFKADEALKSYLPAEKQDPENVKLLLRIARQYRHLMSETADEKEKLRLGGIALSYGKKAAKLAPNDSEAQLSPAITYGKMLPYQGKAEQVAAAPLIKAAADKAIKLDPGNDSAWHVLGRWHQGLANVGSVKRAVGGVLFGSLPKGSHAESIACFEKAIAINPRRLRHHIEEGITYAQMGDDVNAKRCIQKGLAMAKTEKDDAELKVRGRMTLEKLP